MTNTATAVAAAPYVALVQPIVTAAVTAAIGVAGSWVACLAGKYLHVQIAQADIDTIKSKAQTIAGQIIAQAADNLAGKSITVSDPTVAAAAVSIIAKTPAVLAAAGWDQDRVARLIVGEIGKLQAQATQISAPLKPSTTT